VVARRTREIGLRMGLGSSQWGVAWLVGWETMILLIAGFALGAVAAAWMGEYIRGLMFGVQPLDPATYLTVAAILTSVVCVAVALLIRRAMSVDPLTALRTE
jgi:ABC-type antimicrobial peptide transport system permease subunit